MSRAKKITLALLIFLVVIQFFRPVKNSGEIEGVNHISAVIPVPENVCLILKTSCYDCHSNNTNYPWYSEIMPLGWWLNHHVQEGKAELNFSEFRLYSSKKQANKLEEMKDEILGKDMPMKSYTWIHKNAILTDNQVKSISDWIDSSKKNLQN